MLTISLFKPTRFCCYLFLLYSFTVWFSGLNTARRSEFPFLAGFTLIILSFKVNMLMVMYMSMCPVMWNKLENLFGQLANWNVKKSWIVINFFCRYDSTFFHRHNVSTFFLLPFTCMCKKASTIHTC